MYFIPPFARRKSVENTFCTMLSKNANVQKEERKSECIWSLWR